jgi:hypothetical protein
MDVSFWCGQVELLVDRTQNALSPRSQRTDQWIQFAHVVLLVALWVCGLTHDSMDCIVVNIRF